MNKFFAPKKMMLASGLIGCSLLLTACAGTLRASWPALSVSHWFGSTLRVSDQGMGEINQQTEMTQSAIEKGVMGKYRLRSGMEMQNGNVVSVIQGMEQGEVKLEFHGLVNGKVNRIDVLDEGVNTVWGTKIGIPFSDLYDKAFGKCQLSHDMTEQFAVICVAPQSQHVSYVFTGAWDGPEGLMPANDILKHWKIARIIWKA
ncbi:RpoE-regulated lipoprotein [Xenorhabdus poinarii]|nr:RpoE-regulated lipoprotein [Xenorhabdus poinarii]